MHITNLQHFVSSAIAAIISSNIAFIDSPIRPKLLQQQQLKATL